MLRLINHIFPVLSLLLVYSTAQAGRPPGPFRFELSAEDSVYEQGGTIVFTLRITNWDEINTHPVLLPGPMYKGRKFIYLRAYANDQYFTEIAKEDGTGIADTRSDLYTYQLAPGKHLDVRLKLYEKARFAVVPSEPHWFNKRLTPGSYRIQAWYMPYEDMEFTGKAHQGTEDRSQYNGSTDYLPINIVATSRPYGGLDKCPDNCGFCTDIARGKWRRVRRAIEEKVRGLDKAGGPAAGNSSNRGYWMDQHRNVAYVSPLANSMLLSLPAYWGHAVGFRSRDSVHYFKLSIQYGRIFPGRGRIQSIAWWMFRSRLPFRTEDVDYIGIKYFEPIPAPNLFSVRSN